MKTRYALSPELIGLRKNKPLVRSHERAWIQTLIIIFVTFCTLFSLLPLAITIINSLRTYTSVQASAFGFPTADTFVQAVSENYSAAWYAVKDSFGRTILAAIIGSFFTTALSAVLAYIICFKEFYFKNFVFMLFITVLLVPSIIGYPILTPLVRNTFKLNDNLAGLLIPIIGGNQVGGMFLMRTFFSQQPKSIYESARMEGANDFHIFFKVTIPLALPIILYYAVGVFSGVYNEFLWASLILDSNMTIVNKMYALVNSGEIGYSNMYAMYIIASLPLVVTTFISLRYFRGGEFASGLKL
ncbi:MAG: carbohydrate ABC transporter permease [Bacilli bacterium]|nr:carbohydrate ABC transporter permease [Bacilli bacterium]